MNYNREHMNIHFMLKLVYWYWYDYIYGLEFIISNIKYSTYLLVY